MLMQDIWITPSVGEVPRWLEDTDVQDGIRALIKMEHTTLSGFRSR